VPSTTPRPRALGHAHAEVGADDLRVDWGDAASERGRTEYRIAADGSLQVRDEVRLADGGWRSFGRSALRRTTDLLRSAADADAPAQPNNK
jgi:hypothetical protein